MDENSKKKEALFKAYSGQAWRDKVKAMSEDQVTAVYLRLKAQNKI